MCLKCSCHKSQCTSWIEVGVHAWVHNMIAWVHRYYTLRGCETFPVTKEFDGAIIAAGKNGVEYCFRIRVKRKWRL